MLNKLLEKKELLFGKKESLEELVIKDPFNEKKLQKAIDAYDLDLNNQYLLKLCIQNNSYEALSFLIEKVGFKIDKLDVNKENLLFLAIREKVNECCKVLLSNNIDINQANINSITPLHLVTKSGMEDIFDIITDRVDNLEIEDKDGRNILFYAIQSKNFEIIKKVFQLTSIKLNFKDNQDNTIVHIKEITANLDLFKFFVSKGLNVDSINKNNEDFLYLNCLDLDVPDELFISFLQKSNLKNRKYGLNEESILMKIVKKILSIDIQVLENKGLVTKYQDRLITFIEHGVDENSLNSENENFLFDVVRAKDDLVLEFLLNRTKVNINQINNHGQNLLDLAIFNGKVNVELVKKLVYTNINCTVKDKDGLTIVEKLVDVILSEDIPNRVRKIGKTKSAKNVNYTQILTFILDYTKIDINQIMFEAEPIVFEIGKSFHVPLLEVFKKHGANLNIVGQKDKLTIFYKVLEAGKDAKDERALFLKMLKYLVLCDVDIDHKDSHGGNVIHKAILDHDLQVVNILTLRVKNYKARDKKGRTYIHNTIWKNKADILKKIAFKNKDLMNIPDKFGLLPINYGVIMGKKEVVFALIKMGAYLNNPYNVNEQFKEQFFSKLGKLEDILSSTMTENERSLMTELVRSMQKELDIE
ncbi:ankyrin repeat domain-containing protein [Arcobacter roscoffensis]|uniref:Ankyrin repeat domain-containing protein n=1 Tax=Arcobacter roscoffensis TaxID=2961520 RepID=A0ABY5E5J5_9BACT|nr:ankyrin repeat domain-containing protein [Arcobacter roscoffensis]UTJ07439.1 ankyrin repeat domain-containing protein [Arcobacter roscoffensis]